MTETVTNITSFKYFTMVGADAGSFLQGQITAHINDIKNLAKTADNSTVSTFQATAISDLKGKVQFGIWIQYDGKDSGEDSFTIVVHNECLASLVAQFKKFGAFSKFTMSEAQDIYPCVTKTLATFSHDKTLADEQAWQAMSIATGNYWITADSQSIFPPQELRLHQRHGINYNKGCYLGQEVIARIYFKSAPKSFLHRIKGTDSKVPAIASKIGENKRVHVVNAIATETGFEALVIARENHLTGFESLPLPPALQEPVARKAKDS